jgi:hypothetical protein
MDGASFDRLARTLVTPRSRRGLVASLLGFGAGVLGVRATDAACPPGRVSRRGQCVCRQTGRPPVGGVCPCPRGQTDTGDGQGCLACRADSDCPGFGDPCLTVACAAGACTSAPANEGGVCPGGVCTGGACCLGLPLQAACTPGSPDPCCGAAGCAFVNFCINEDFSEQPAGDYCCLDVGEGPCTDTCQCCGFLGCNDGVCS